MRVQNACISKVSVVFHCKDNRNITFKIIMLIKLFDLKLQFAKPFRLDRVKLEVESNRIERI